jgi:hypothetical protein
MVASKDTDRAQRVSVSTLIRRLVESATIMRRQHTARQPVKTARHTGNSGSPASRALQYGQMRGASQPAQKVVNTI